MPQPLRSSRQSRRPLVAKKRPFPSRARDIPKKLNASQLYRRGDFRLVVGRVATSIDRRYAAAGLLSVAVLAVLFFFHPRNLAATCDPAQTSCHTFFQTSWSTLVSNTTDNCTAAGAGVAKGPNAGCIGRDDQTGWVKYQNKTGSVDPAASDTTGGTAIKLLTGVTTQPLVQGDNASELAPNGPGGLSVVATTQTSTVNGTSVSAAASAPSFVAPGTAGASNVTATLGSGPAPSVTYNKCNSVSGAKPTMPSLPAVGSCVAWNGTWCTATSGAGHAYCKVISYGAAYSPASGDITTSFTSSIPINWKQYRFSGCVSNQYSATTSFTTTIALPSPYTGKQCLTSQTVSYSGSISVPAGWTLGTFKNWSTPPPASVTITAPSVSGTNFSGTITNGTSSTFTTSPVFNISKVVPGSASPTYTASLPANATVVGTPQVSLSQTRR